MTQPEAAELSKEKKPSGKDRESPDVRGLKDGILLIDTLLGPCDAGTSDHSWRKCRRCLWLHSLESPGAPTRRALEALREAALASPSVCKRCNGTRSVRDYGQGEAWSRTVDCPDCASPSVPQPARVSGESWEQLPIGKSTYFQCPSCKVARVTEWCPPPCNTQSANFKRLREAR